MSSGYPGHSGGAGHSSGHHSQSNPPTSSSTMSRGALPANTSTSQILPPSASSSQSTAQASPSQRSSSSASSAKAKWYFTPERLSNTPSVDAGIPIEKELSYRQQAANFIQDMGQRLKVTQLCINTAIVYMQRFYMFHSFAKFHRNTIAAASLFLAAKVEEQPRKLEHVIKVAHICLHRDQPQLDSRSDVYIEQAQELVINENILLQTLGFDVAIDHPHTHVVHCCQLVKASKELAQTSYFMATNSLHLTTMCLRHPPKIVACVCIHLACKWSNYKIPLSRLKKEWFMHVLEPNWSMDSITTLNLLEELTNEFLTIFEQCPSRLKKKIMASTQATKQEEERRQNSDVQPGNYQPDFTVHNESATTSGATTGLMAAVLKGPQEHKQAGSIGAAKSQSKLSSSSLTHSQRSSSNPQTSVPISSHTSHGGLTSTTVPGTHHSAQGNSQSTTAQPKSSRQSAPFSTGFSASHGNVNRSQGHSSSNDGNARSESGNRHGDKHPSSKSHSQVNTAVSNSTRPQSHHTQPSNDHKRQSLPPNMDKLSMEAYKKRQVHPHPGPNTSGQNSLLSRPSGTSDSGHQVRESRKRHEQQHHSNVKKANTAANMQNPHPSQGKQLSNQPLNLNNPASATSSSQLSMPGIDNSFHASQSQQGKYHPGKSSSGVSGQQQQSSSSRAAWSQLQNSSRASTSSEIPRTQQPTHKKSIFDIDSPPPIPNQGKIFDKKPIDRTESLEPGEIFDEETDEANKLFSSAQSSSATATASGQGTTMTPLQQRLFGSSVPGKAAEQSTNKISSNILDQKDISVKSERKNINPLLWGSSAKTTSPVKQGKLNVMVPKTSDSVKQEIPANRRSLFSPPSDSEGATIGSQDPPFKVVKSPANNNRLSNPNNAARDARRTISNSANDDNRSCKQEPNIDSYDIDRTGRQLVTTKVENSANNPDLQNYDAVGNKQKSQYIPNLFKADPDLDQKIPASIIPIKDEYADPSYDSPSDRHKKDKKHKKEKKHKKDKKHDKERGDRSDKERSSSKHRSKHMADSNVNEASYSKTSSSSYHQDKHHRSQLKDAQMFGDSSMGSYNQLASSLTPTGPAAYSATTPQIDTPSSTTSTTSGLKLKIKLAPPPGGTPVSSSQGNSKTPSIAPLRISLGGSGEPNRKRVHKGDSSHVGPASKMSRVLGTPVEAEHKFLASKGLPQHSSSHSSKVNKKVK